jgi:hypothetical protein
MKEIEEPARICRGVPLIIPHIPFGLSGLLRIMSPRGLVMEIGMHEFPPVVHLSKTLPPAIEVVIAIREGRPVVRMQLVPLIPIIPRNMQFPPFPL